MKPSELTQDIVRHAILPATSMKDQEATMKWLAYPPELRGRCRAAERIAVLINGSNMPRRAEPLPIPAPTPVPPAPKVEAKVEEAPESSPTVASVDIKSDGSVTVHPRKASSLPPAPTEAPTMAERAELQVAVGKALAELQDPAPKPKAEVDLELTPEAALRAIRALYKSWKGGPYVCGNAYKTMNQVEELIARAGF